MEDSYLPVVLILFQLVIMENEKKEIALSEKSCQPNTYYCYIKEGPRIITLAYKIISENEKIQIVPLEGKNSVDSGAADDELGKKEKSKTITVFSGHVIYGGAMFTKTKKNETFVKKCHRETATGRLNKGAIHSDYEWISLKDLENQLRKQVFKFGMGGRKVNQLHSLKDSRVNISGGPLCLKSSNSTNIQHQMSSNRVVTRVGDKPSICGRFTIEV